MPLTWSMWPVETYLALLDDPPHHALLHIPGIELLEGDVLVLPQLGRLVYLAKELREGNAALLFRKTVVVSVMLDIELPAGVVWYGVC